jgi:hypothetical protein
MTPTTRVLIAAARAGLDPDPGAAARVRAKLDLALGAPAAAAVVPAAAAPAGGFALKLLVALAIGAGAGVLAVPRQTAPATAVPAPMFDDVIATDVPHARVIVSATESAAPAPAWATAAPAPASHAQPIVHRAAAAAPTGEISLAREVQLIDQAMASLRAGQPAAALTAIATYHREAAERGQLAEEAAAIDIEASCKLHLDTGDKLASFDQTWPSSAQRSRLTAACTR